MSSNYNGLFPGKMAYDSEFKSLQDDLLHQIHEHPLSHESMGGVRGLVLASRKVFDHENSHFEDLYILLRKINQAVHKLNDTNNQSVAKQRFRDAILHYPRGGNPRGGSRERIFTILLDLNIARDSNTWSNFASQISVRDPESGNDQLRDEQLPFSLDQIKCFFGEENCDKIYERQYKFCDPLTEAFAVAAGELEHAMSEKFCTPKNEEDIELNEVHVSYFCPNIGPVHVVESAPNLVQNFFVQCRLARILKYGTKEIALQYKLKEKAHLDAQKFCNGVHLRAKILAILLHIRIHPTDDAWNRFFHICLGFSPSERDGDTQLSRRNPSPDVTVSDQELPLDNAESITKLFGLESHDARKFLSSQSLFCAAVLQEGEQLLIPANRLLPLSHKSKIGGGAHGTVYRVKVVEGHVTDKDGLPKKQTKYWAMKRISPEDRDEWLRVKWVKEQNLRHNCIMRARAALKSTTDLFVFFNLAKCNLHSFMREEQHWKTWVRDREGKLNALKRMRDIADAIQYLHHHLVNLEGSRIVCYHKDLRADNILVEHGDSDVRFKITDFGLSSVQGMYPNQESSASSSRTIAHILTSAPIGQNCSNFPPEALTGMIDSRADIWAYGTIYAEFVAWLSGGSQKLDKYVQARALKGYEWSFEIDESGCAILRTTIEIFFTELIQESDEEGDRRLYESTRRLLKEKVLVCQPNHRAEIKETHKILCAICKGEQTTSFFRSNVPEDRAMYKASTPSEAPRNPLPRSFTTTTNMSTSTKETPINPVLAPAKTFPMQRDLPFNNSTKPDRWASIERAEHIESVGTKDTLESLIDSIKGGKEEAFNRQLAKMIPLALNRQGADGETPLDIAIKESATKFALKLLDKGAEPRYCSKVNASILHRAVASNTAEVIEKLIKHGEDPNVTDRDGRTPLLLAISSNNEAAATKLLDRGAKMDVCDNLGWNALHFAFNLTSSMEIVKRILAEHSELKDGPNNEGKTPLHECAKRSTKESMELARILLRDKCNVNASDIDGRTPLSYAAEKADREEMVRLLVGYKAEFGTRGRRGEWKRYMSLLKN